MQRAIFSLFIFLILLNSCAQNDKNSSNDHLKTLNEEITGDLAFETTAFVEQYWRVVGNTGFNKSIYWVADYLEKAGYVNEDKATEDDILTYRIERRPLKRPTWESVDATLTIVGEETSLLSHDTNRNMIALNSFSTSEEGVTAEVVHVNDVKELESYEVKGKIVFAETHPSRIFKQVVSEKGALGIITYNNPSYLQPEKNKTSIQFRSIPLDTISKSWGIALSYEAKEKLKASLAKGKTELNVKIKTNIYPSEELTIVADIKGSELPEERLVFSAHVQEPGANDNASGVGAALEMAVVTAKLLKEGKFVPKRTLTYLWGDEIISTRRYVQDDSIRAKKIKWGISLDMVGEDTEKTGGSFLIEKMPDPSAIWTRGNDKHTEWGGRPLKKEDMTPHYLNDFVIKKFKEQGKLANWEVNTNPYEGGSDHVPFLRGNIPSVLFWHFTDQFYHTDNDRIDKVSNTTLKNVSVGSLGIAFELLNSDKDTATSILKDIEHSALARLNEEQHQSKLAIENGETLESQIDIIKTWEDWYLKTSNSVIDMLDVQTSLKNEIKQTQDKISNRANEILKELKG